MTINGKYFVMPPLQQVLHDKLDGALLSNGVVTFYKDNARTVKKDIYQLTGVPADYSYTTLENPLTLSSIGSYVDEVGNNIIPLLYPYNEDGNVELYYITVVNEDAVNQFTVQGWPHVMAATSETTGTDNFVPNGQFLLHNYISETGELDNSAVVNVAYGGWTFERSPATTSKDVITFQRYGSYVTTPSSSPRYAIKIVAEIPSVADVYKNLCLTFNDVNKFASDTQTWTLSFYAKAVSSTVQITPSVIKNYGSGGDPSTFKDYQSISITTSGNVYNIPIIFGNNTGKTIGTNNDDYMKIAFKCPPTYAFGIIFTDVCLLRNNIVVAEYPIETVSQVIYKSLAGFLPIPAYDGSNLGLRFFLGKNGIEYDMAHVGMIYKLAIPYDSARHRTMLPCAGNAYNSFDYSFDGIPYKRLRDALAVADEISPIVKYWGQPRYGTGLEYCTAEGDIVDTSLVYITVNSSGAYTHANDGSIPTTFTFTNFDTHITGWTTTKITVKAASAITAGAFLEFYNHLGLKYIGWYKKDGVGTKPVTAATGYIEIGIIGADTIAQVAEKTYRAINYAYFAVPFYYGAFLRGASYWSARDPDKNSRLNSTLYGQFGVIGNRVGSMQNDDIRNHAHSFINDKNIGGSQPWGNNGSNTTQFTDSTGATGGNETRPINIYIDYAIGY